MQKEIKIIGIIGGGQLGKMLIEHGIKWNQKFLVLESDTEQLLRIILGFQLGSTELVKPTITMNLLGPKNYEGSYELQNLNKLMMIDNLHIHHYGKYKSKPDRKLGHITMLLDNYPPSEDYVNDIKKLAIITPCD